MTKNRVAWEMYGLPPPPVPRMPAPMAMDCSSFSVACHMSEVLCLLLLRSSGGVDYRAPAERPPSTMYTPPVQKLLSSLARNSIIRATSSGFP